MSFQSFFISKIIYNCVDLYNITDFNLMLQDKLDGIYIDSANKDLISTKIIIDKIQDICQKIQVKCGRNKYLIKRGLPQGLGISSVLSSFYYHSLEKEYLFELITQIQQTQLLQIMRLTDDYIIMSESKESIKVIIQRLFKMAEENNFEFNYAKLITNLDDEERIQKEAKWIGKIIDLNKLELEHIQITSKLDAFYSINVNL